MGTITPFKRAEDITLDELFLPEPRIELRDRKMLSRARKAAQRIAYKRPFSGPQEREMRTAADILKFRVELGSHERVHFIDKETGEIFEPMQIGDSVVEVFRSRLRRMGYELQVEYVHAAQKRLAR